MAKGYSFVDLAQPLTPSATAVAGGSLIASTTYYYRILKVSTLASTYNFYGKSIISDQFSVTTDATNKTARITFSCTLEAGTSYRIYRSTSSTALGRTLNTPFLAFYPNDNTHNISGTVTFDDNGSYSTVSNNFVEIDDKAHGRLTLSGSTSSDRFTIVDLYNADVAAGWGVILKLDANTYKINCHLIGHTNLYWRDTEKTIIFADGATFGTDHNFTFGEITGSNITKNGCKIIVSSSWLTNFNWGTLTAYRTIFSYTYIRDTAGVSVNNGYGYTAGTFASGIVQDCQVDRWRNFIPVGGANCTIKNFTMSILDNAFSNYAATYDNVRVLSGSRVWQITSANLHLVARNVYTEGIYAVLVTTDAATSSLSTINSIIANSIIVASTATGFKWYDKISFALNIVDEDGLGINGANLKIYDTDNTKIVDADSDSNGDVVEQLITRRYFEVSGTSVLPENNRNPFTIVVSKTGYETYTEIVTYSASNAVVKTIALNSQLGKIYLGSTLLTKIALG